ncbi:hypothetical protein FE243_09185 [Aliarcobacter thereius]|uniref:hypothetical protein n=1 Tax=Aliarcobacter thereius TaxID=544718 RepID=UPI0010FEC7F1|nr:hypothetical protein [Aliarcobacter thereius]TLT05867.1 hypothetical protein FE243_09185 [Aliarcobacter thereius]
MEIQNNQNLYNTYHKNREKLDVLPIEAFKIDKNNIAGNKDNPNNIETKPYVTASNSRFAYVIKSGIDKDTPVYDHFINLGEQQIEFIETKGKYLDPNGYSWYQSSKIATYGNLYEEAKGFENFVDNLMKQGYGEWDALARAATYAKAGLLDYGKQKAIPIYPLAYDDKKQHGFHLIDNPPLKKAFLETLNSLDNVTAAQLVDSFFEDFPNKVPTAFQELLSQFGIKLEELKETQPEEERSKFTFTGDININDKMSLEYQNFIFDTLIGFFKDRVVFLEEFEEKEPDARLENLRNAYDILIENFKKNTKEYNETKNILNQYMR